METYLYVIQCKDNALYCGRTADLIHRITQHWRGRGARFTRDRGCRRVIGIWKLTQHEGGAEERKLLYSTRAAFPHLTVAGAGCCKA